MNGMFMQGPAVPVHPENVQSSVYWKTAVDVVSTTDDFAGLNTANTHLQATPSSDTSSIMVAGVANKKIVVNEIAVNQTGSTTGYVGTLAQEGETADIIQFACGQYGQATFDSVFELEAGKGLVLYRAQGATNSATADANIVNVYYTYVDA